VIERSILEHQYDDVFDSVIGHAQFYPNIRGSIDRSGDEPCKPELIG
jgi:hypothetical protein